MAQITLHRGDLFCIADAVKNGVSRLFIKVGTHNPVPTFTESPSGQVPDSVTIEQWEQLDDEVIETGTNYLQDGNALVLDGLVGSRPKKAKKNS